MFRFVAFALVWLLSNVAAYANALHFNSTQSAGSANMQTFGITSMPIGYYEYCLRYTARCDRQPEGSEIALTPSSWTSVVRVNADVNAQVAPKTDLEIFGVEERWEYPTNVGDCEDYALLKRARLNEMGYPLGALLMTVAKDAQGGGHAVLTVVTDRGDLILDNLEPKVLFWQETEIQYLKRQSSEDLNVWVSLVDTERLQMSARPGRDLSSTAANPL